MDIIKLRLRQFAQIALILFIMPIVFVIIGNISNEPGKLVINWLAENSIFNVIITALDKVIEYGNSDQTWNTILKDVAINGYIKSFLHILFAGFTVQIFKKGGEILGLKDGDLLPVFLGVAFYSLVCAFIETSPESAQMIFYCFAVIMQIIAMIVMCKCVFGMGQKKVVSVHRYIYVVLFQIFLDSINAYCVYFYIVLCVCLGLLQDNMSCSLFYSIKTCLIMGVVLILVTYLVDMVKKIERIA